MPPHGIGSNGIGLANTRKRLNQPYGDRADARANAARGRRNGGHDLDPVSHGRIRMKRFSVLIVDDEPLAREGLRMLLTSDPQVAAISEAKNGREAVTAIRDTRPDLVFLDVQMPEMDGFDVVGKLLP